MVIQRTNAGRSGADRCIGDRLHWFALRVKPTKESVASAVLRQRGIRTELPVKIVYRRKSRFSRNKTERRYPLMPGYVLAGFETSLPPWFEILNLSLVHGVVGLHGQPARLPERSVMEMVARSDKGDFTAPDSHRFMRTHHEFAAGDRVQVLSGPLKGHEFVVDAIDGPEAEVLWQMLGGEQNLRLALDNLVAA